MSRSTSVKSRVRSSLVHAACQPLERRVLLSLAPAGAEFLVNSFTTNRQEFPAITMDGDGDAVVVWQSNLQDGGGYGIYAQRYNASGVPQGGEFRVNTFTTGNQSEPAVAMDADGDFVVVWDSFGQDGSGNGIFAQRYNAAGQPQGSEFRVNVFTTSQQAQPAVATDVAGNFVVAWTSRDQDGNLLGVYARRYDFLGIPQGGGEFRVNTITLGDQSSPAVAVTPSGDFIVAWESGGGPNFDVSAQRYNAAGQPQGTEFRVNTYTTGTQNFPAVAMDPSGDFVVAWQSEAQDGEIFGVYAQRFDAAGNAQGGEFRVNQFTSGSQQTPALVMDGAGNFLITWASGGNQDGAGYGVYARQYNAAGAAQGNEFRVNTFTTGSQSTPSLAMAGSTGDVAVTWYSSAQDGSSTGVYAQRYAESPDAAGPVVGGVFAGGTRVLPYSVHQPPVQQIVVSLSENVANATDVSNWLLTRDGLDITSQISSVTFGHNSATNRYEATLNLSAVQTGVNYSLVARDTLRDASGNALDGNLDGTPGGSSALPFSIAALPQGGEVRVNTYTPGVQFIPSVASDADGDFVVVWRSQEQDGSGYGIFGQRYDKDGAPQGTEFQVNLTTLGDQLHPTVAMDAIGNFVVTWTSLQQEHGMDDGGIYARRYSAAGVALSGEMHVNTYTTGFQGFPRIAMDADGDVVISWTSNYQDGNFGGVYARRFDASGAPQGTEFRVNSYTTGNQGVVSAGMAPNGSFVVLWGSGGQDGSGYGVYARQYSAAGVPQGNDIQVNTFTTNDQQAGGVALDAEGNFVVVWASDRQTGSGWSTHAQRYSAAGARLGAEFQVSSFTGMPPLVPKVAMQTNGEFIIVSAGRGQDGDLDGVYARRFAASGVALGNEFRVNTYTTGDQRRPWVTVDSGGDFVIAWDSDGQDGSSVGIYAQRYASPATPTVGSLADSPDPVLASDPITLSASNVTDNGTVTGVSFYRESNSVAGLQVGFQGDTLVGTANAPAGGVWSVQVTTAGLGGTYTYWAQATDNASLIGTPASTTNTVIPSNPPGVVASSFHYATRPHALRFTFTQNVSASLGLDDIVIVRLPGGGPAPTPEAVTYDAATNTASFRFDVPLPDGRYRATLLAAGVTNAAGEPLPADHVLEFTFLRGDANGDGRVNLNDFNVLAANFGQSPRDFTQGDFDYSGNVNLNDFNILASRFGTVVGPTATDAARDAGDERLSGELEELLG